MPPTGIHLALNEISLKLVNNSNKAKIIINKPIENFKIVISPESEKRDQV